MTRDEAVALLDAFVRYAYNCSFDEFEALYPTASTGYRLEKFKYMQRNLGAFFGELDTGNRHKLVELIVDRYRRKENNTIPLDDSAEVTA